METTNKYFISNTFQNIWKQRFVSKKAIKTFKCIDGVNFYSNKSIFYNVGRNLTKGNTYTLNNSEDLKNKTLVIYDVLAHLNTIPKKIPPYLGILKSAQYVGFLIRVDAFKSLDDYLLKTFSKNTRSKMRKFTNRLDTCFNITTKMFFGAIDKAEYDAIFIKFWALLQKRYSEKKVYYNNMQPDEWNFYKEVAYPLILEKKASLFVVYDNGIPIAITYNYHNKDILIDAITVFDTDYIKFNLGYVNNLKLLNWCFNNNMKVLDFSKGYFDYKKRMCTLEYDFEYHIIYDKQFALSKLRAYLLFGYFEMKAALRNKDYNTKFHKITYRFKNLKLSKPTRECAAITLDKLPNTNELTAILIDQEPEYTFLKKQINDFLYLSICPQKNIKVFKLKNVNKTYILWSESLIHQINFIR